MALHGAKVFTSLDMQSGYWQIPVAAADISKTAFVCHKSLFEFVRMPFGLCNAPGIFRWTMERVLYGLVGEICLVYLDDVVVFGKTKEKHAENWRIILERFRDHNLTLKPSKCSFSKVSLKLLGYIVGADGIFWPRWTKSYSCPSSTIHGKSAENRKHFRFRMVMEHLTNVYNWNWFFFL